MRIYLASTSPARLMLLRAAGIEPYLVSPTTDEDSEIAEKEREIGRPLTGPETTQYLATAKAESAVKQLPKATGVFVGSDSMFELEGKLLGKPHTPERAKERWLNQIGKTGALHSGICAILVQDGKIVKQITTGTSAEVTFVSDITDTEIDAYIATGEPLKVAGAFTIDSLGSAFVKEISGDPSTVVGMSIPQLRVLVRELGIEWQSLWNLQQK